MHLKVLRSLSALGKNAAYTTSLKKLKDSIEQHRIDQRYRFARLRYKMEPQEARNQWLEEAFREEKKELVENFHRFNGLKHTKIIPKAFTEKGLYMLGTILKSKQATQTTFLIIETFVKLRALQETVASATISKGNKKKNLLKKSGELMADLLDTDLTETEAETTLELNFAVLKLKHTTKRKKD